jgi:hypothetical protein
VSGVLASSADRCPPRRSDGWSRSAWAASERVHAGLPRSNRSPRFPAPSGSQPPPGLPWFGPRRAGARHRVRAAPNPPSLRAWRAWTARARPRVRRRASRHRAAVGCAHARPATSPREPAPREMAAGDGSSPSCGRVVPRRTRASWRRVAEGVRTGPAGGGHASAGLGVWPNQDARVVLAGGAEGGANGGGGVAARGWRRWSSGRRGVTGRCRGETGAGGGHEDGRALERPAVGGRVAAAVPQGAISGRRPRRSRARRNRRRAGGAGRWPAPCRAGSPASARASPGCAPSRTAPGTSTWGSPSPGR